MGGGISDLFIDPSPEHVGGGNLGRLHLVFLMFVYGFILSKSSNLIADGSELLLLVPSLAGIVGSVVLPVLGAVPDGAIVLFSGIGPIDQVKEQISVGVGALAGSTIMLLTIPWALCIIQGRVDINNGEANYKGKPKLSAQNKYSLVHAGISPRGTIAINGRIMVITLISYVVVQAAAFGSACGHDDTCKTRTEHWAVLVAMLLSIICFIGYLVYNVKFADQEEKEEKIVEVKKKAIDSHVISLSTAFETSLFETSGDRTSRDENKRFEEALKVFYNRYDTNRDGVLDAFELRALLTDVGEEMSESRFQALFKEIDTDGSGEIAFHEFAHAMRNFIKSKAEHGDATSDKRPLTMSLGSTSELSGSPDTMRLDSIRTEGADEEGKKGKGEWGHEDKEGEGEEDDDGEEEEEVPEDIAKLPKEKQQMRILLRAGWMMGVGTLIVILFSDPMVDVFSAFGNSIGVPPFYVAFVLAPIASNASELIASINYAKKKTKKTITISLVALEGAASMNNTFCLFIFLVLIFANSALAWEFSAETISIVFIELCLFGFTFLKTMRVWHAIVIILLYPFAIFVVWFFENVVGLN